SAAMTFYPEPEFRAGRLIMPRVHQQSPMRAPDPEAITPARLLSTLAQSASVKEYQGLVANTAGKTDWLECIQPMRFA
ncbi:MAG TPA: hypothetical protein VFK82_03420, partial [Burkholderiaceae bacterium]|nr:hypothetical protein [Burkholderiaceae bacterium]